MNRIKYKLSFSTYQNSTQFNSDCSDITFVNNGASSCIINNDFTLAAGASLSVSCQANEIDTTIYQISFTPSGLNNSLQVIKKNFV
jgi:hypothetical protein